MPDNVTVLGITHARRVISTVTRCWTRCGLPFRISNRHRVLSGFPLAEWTKEEVDCMACVASTTTGTDA